MKYSHKESAVLEFKLDVPSKKHVLLKTVVGFANTYGGEIVIGVDNNAEIIGVPESKVDAIMDDLTRSIYDAIAPSLFPSIYTKRYGEKLVIIVDIAEGSQKPYHLGGKRIHEGTYVRLGSHTVLATQDIIHQLQWQKSHKFLDEMPVHEASIKDIDIPAFENFLKERKQKNSSVDTREMLYHYHILTKDRAKVYPTVGGILLFGKKPQQFFPEAFVICTHFAGTSGRDAIATRDSDSHLFQQYKDVTAFIISRLNTSFKIEGAGRRIEQLEIPPEAIREVVINALVHRNYQINGPSKISVYDDRVEIFSPGNFPGPIMADKVNIGVTYIRNSIITRVFRDTGIIEKLGSGFITLFETYSKRGLPKPVVSEGIGFVKCILPRPIQGMKSKIESEGDRVLQLFLKADEIKPQDVMAFMSISRASTSRLLSKLVEEGILEKIGKGPSTRYRKL